MAVVKLNQTIDCDKKNLLSVISDVSSYPDFLPWIHSLRVSERTTSGLKSEFNAHVRVGFKLFSESFSTRVIVDDNHSIDKPASVEMKLIQGPFRSLNGKWSIQPITSNQCMVSLELSLEFSNPLLGAVFAANQEKIAQKIIKIFTDRSMYLSKKNTSV
jgi:coenzyme Q-binding protein COQ10